MICQCVRSATALSVRLNGNLLCKRTLLHNPSRCSSPNAGRDTRFLNAVGTLQTQMVETSFKKATSQNIFKPAAFFRCIATSQTACARLKPEEIRRRVDDLTSQFAEARELLGDAVHTTHSSDCFTSFSYLTFHTSPICSVFFHLFHYKRFILISAELASGKFFFHQFPLSF